MAFEVVMATKGKLGGKQPEAVTLNLKLGRIVILANIYAVMKTLFGSEVQCVRLLFDEDRRDVFLIQPCNKEDPGARRLDKTPGTSPSLSARSLFSRLGLGQGESKRCPVTWDEEHGGFLVHWTKEVGGKDSIESSLPRLKQESEDKKKKAKG